MKEKIANFINEMILYDFILFGTALALFLLLIILALLLRRRARVSITLIMLGFLILLLLPSVGYSQLHAYLFKNDVTITEIKNLAGIQKPARLPFFIPVGMAHRNNSVLHF